ncbi:CBL-interacting serine/threonine-protein kinase 23 [Phlyctochytrium planicorne]|nr:CBL-interacting serine/threonine-protein kinase 23 [Phlyctochytrium planicorne]
MDNLEASYSAITLPVADDFEMPIEENFEAFINGLVQTHSTIEKEVSASNSLGRDSASVGFSQISAEDFKYNPSLSSSRSNLLSLSRAKSITLNNDLPRQSEPRDFGGLLDGLGDESIQHDFLDQHDVPALDFGDLAVSYMGEDFRDAPNQTENDFNFDAVVPDAPESAAPQSNAAKKKRKRVHFGDYETELSNSDMRNLQQVASYALTWNEYVSMRKKRDRRLKEIASKIVTERFTVNHAQVGIPTPSFYLRLFGDDFDSIAFNYIDGDDVDHTYEVWRTAHSREGSASTPSASLRIGKQESDKVRPAEGMNNPSRMSYTSDDLSNPAYDFDADTISFEDSAGHVMMPNENSLIDDISQSQGNKIDFKSMIDEYDLDDGKSITLDEVFASKPSCSTLVAGFYQLLAITTSGYVKVQQKRPFASIAIRKVKVGVHVETGATAAVKIMTKHDVIELGMSDQVKNEIMIMKRIRHKNIINMQDAMASKNRIYIVQELVTGGELLYHLASEGSFSEDVAHDYFKQLMEGVQYCHSVGVAHRDIKPEITDFGLAVSMQDGTLLYRAAGTPAYLAPEYPFTEPDMSRKIDRYIADEVLQHEWVRRETRLAKKHLEGEKSESSSNVERPAKAVTVFDLLQMCDLFDITSILSRTKKRSTKFMTKKSREEVIKRLTAILCTLPLTFTTIDIQNKINIQAPYANEMIVMVSILKGNT